MPLYKPYKLYICTRFSTQVLPTRPWHPLSPPSIEVTASKGSSRCIRPTPHEASVAIKPEQLDMSLTYTVFHRHVTSHSWRVETLTLGHRKERSWKKSRSNWSESWKRSMIPLYHPSSILILQTLRQCKKRQSDRDGNVRPITQL